MKRTSLFLSLCLSTLLLCGCVFPLQHVSPDPDPALSLRVSGSPSDSADFAIPSPRFRFRLRRGRRFGPGRLPAGLPVIDDPKLAVFWYAMADAEVFAFREQFGPFWRTPAFLPGNLTRKTTVPPAGSDPGRPLRRLESAGRPVGGQPDRGRSQRDPGACSRNAGSLL